MKLAMETSGTCSIPLFQSPSLLVLLKGSCNIVYNFKCTVPMSQPPENRHGRSMHPFFTDFRESHDFRAASEGKENSSCIHSFFHPFIILQVF